MRPGSGTRTGARSDPSITASGSESEVVAIGVGNYRFPAIVYEMTLASRPASPGTNVPSRNRSAPLELSSSPTVRVNAHEVTPIPGSASPDLVFEHLFD